ncbi:MAG: hypothetical protein CVT74_03320 [Alphaproteobacteria bacterium HGW-Alphaproteobacteria-13]|nr:MAG: hypothetical protein CVT74_03320 [Alphaproteobacteria bacterium HGW-Alphaproteobacteria-13]
MSAAHWPWTVLDIAPTEDRKTIREAYSRRLKALDHEAETEAYMALRQARDAALSGQFLHPEGEEEDEQAGGEVEAEAPPPMADEPQDKPVFTVEYDESDDRRFQRVVDLFLGEDALAAADAEELDAHLDTLFADERMGDLGHYARIEAWLAQLLAERYPRGVALFPRVAEYFHWADRAHELGVHPAIPWLFNAYEADSVVSQLDAPGHAYHREWVELTSGKPKGPLWVRAIDKTRMANLIATIRRDYPWLEQQHWQQDLVARWEKKTAGTNVKGPNIWVWIALAFVALSALGRLADGDSSRTAANPMALAVEQSAAADRQIAAFIDQRFPQAQADGRSLDTLRAKSPRAYSTLQKAIGTSSMSDEMRTRFLMREITDVYYQIIDRMPYELQVADARFRAATVKKLKDNPRDCARFIGNPAAYWREGNSAAAVSADYQYQMSAVFHDQYVDREWPLAPRTAEISGPLIERLIRRSGVPEDRVRAALHSPDVPQADLCRTIGSLYEILTEIPAKEASKILPAVL